MFIKILWIIVYLATFLGIRADTSLQQTRYEERLNLVEKVLMKQSNEIEDLKTVVQTQKNEITQLKMTLSKVKRVQGIQEKSISVLRKLIMKSRVILESTPEENTWLEKDKQDKNLNPLSEMTKRKVSINRASRLGNVLSSARDVQPVAFYALLSHDELNPGPHHTIVFDLVKTNIHNSYNHFTGAFTAPINGVYGFIYTLRMPCGTVGTFEIIKNNEVEGTIHVNVNGGCSGQFSTGTIIVVLNIGDAVYVRTHSTITPTGRILSDDNGGPYFAGWLIASL
ncbi:Hypothetical predicted protein [Mytilus galloprovincialis]|uniref:C1q domain-containing protein n=1 Tax=Mytilus galloprovincialis TaxID=29158 RepID=A0A8B6F4W6_MYTGA|nr:Hypothetical predicted protein [Mytilus galloprovincialis]